LAALPNMEMPFDARKKLSRFLTKLSDSWSRTLVVSDNILVPFFSERKEGVADGIPVLLDRLQNTARTRLVITAGRRAKHVAALLRVPGVEIWGCHGLERLRADGTHEEFTPDHRILDRIAEATDLLVKRGLADKLELKVAGTAIHWSELEASADELKAMVQEVWSLLSSREGLQLMKFDAGIEIRALTRNKGDVVRTLLAETRRDVSIAYLGSDFTDEDAFAALQGFGLSVLVQQRYRPTIADVWICPPDGITAFLSEWTEACNSR
jgi:trehalose-phosphatase